MKQVAEVMDYIKKNGSITTMQAFGIGITRLASRVHDLRSCGVPVEREMIAVQNRHGETCRVARYTIPAEYWGATK